MTEQRLGLKERKDGLPGRAPIFAFTASSLTPLIPGFCSEPAQTGLLHPSCPALDICSCLLLWGAASTPLGSEIQMWTKGWDGDLKQQSRVRGTRVLVEMKGEPMTRCLIMILIIYSCQGWFLSLFDAPMLRPDQFLGNINVAFRHIMLNPHHHTGNLLRSPSDKEDYEELGSSFRSEH